ncbi:MAG: phosphoribosylglycinamide formyltransferase [Bacteroidales bacterium]
MSIVKIAIFASGSGTNAENIIKYFYGSTLCKVELVLSNKNNAFVLERAKKLGVDTFVFSVNQLNEFTLVDELLEARRIDFIVLAGFLLKIPQRILEKYPSRIINIHPALLPSYGGKGMYGMKVHQAVIEAGEPESGITIHLVDENYDNGKVLFQARCSISNGDTAEDLANKIHLLEQAHFPRVIEEYITTC